MADFNHRAGKCSCDGPHREALQVSASVHQLALPKFPVRGRAVLDVGCSDGATLMHPLYQEAAVRFGIDVDEEAISRGQKNYPELKLSVASAESLPYDDASFEVVISKVSLLFTEVRRSLTEVFRVLRPGGHLFLTTHDWRHQAHHLNVAIRQRAYKRMIDHAYIAVASGIYIATGLIPARPWNGCRETFQSKGSLRRDLERAGFDEIEFQRTKRDFIVNAHKT